MDNDTIVGKLKILGKGFSQLIKKGLDGLFDLGKESTQPKESYMRQIQKPTPEISTITDKEKSPKIKKGVDEKKSDEAKPRKTPKRRTKKTTLSKRKTGLTREQIMDRAYEILRNNSDGITPTDLASQIGVKPQALPHPLKKLILEKNIVKAGNYYFPSKEAAESASARKKIKRGGLKEPELDSKITGIVRDNPGLKLAEIAEKLGKSRQGIAKAGKRLLDEGTIVKKDNKYYLP